MPQPLFKFLALFFVLGLCGAFSAQRALAQASQTTGAIEGFVTDEMTKAGIPGALVQIKNVTTGVSYVRLTDASGKYNFDYIPAGFYDLSATAENVGYDATTYSTQPKYPIDFRQTTVVKPPPLQLRKRGVAPGPGVTPPPPPVKINPVLVNLQDGSRNLKFNQSVISSLPFAGVRTFDNLALLAAGVAPSPQAIGNTTGPGVGAGVGTSGQFAVNGLRSRGNNFTVDGSDNNDDDIGVRRQGFTSLVPQGIETVQQFNVATLLSRPQFGRNLGGQVDVISQYGGQMFHGSLFGFYTDRRLKARDAFDLKAITNAPTPILRASNGTPVMVGGQQFRLPDPTGGEDSLTRGQLGGVLSGQLTKKQTFFLASYEHREINGGKESNFAVPTVAERGLFNSGETGLTVTTGQNVKIVFPTSAKGDAFYSLFPFANNPRGPYGPNTYTQVLPANARGEIASFRIDQTFPFTQQGQASQPNQATQRPQNLAARYNVTDDETILPVTGEALFSALRAQVRTQNVSLVLSGALNDRTAQTLRFSYGRTRLRFEEVRQPFDNFLLPSKLKVNGKDVPFMLNAKLLLNGTLSPQNPNYVSFNDDTEGDIRQGNGTDPVGQVFVSGFSPLGVDVYNFPQSRVNNTFQIADTVSFNPGNNSIHHVQGGVDFRRLQLNSSLDRNFRSIASFSGALNVSGRFGPPNVFSGNPILRGSDFIAVGAATGFTQTQALVSDSTIGLRQWQSNLFFEDQLDVARNFKLTLGLRYELNSVPSEVNNRIDSTFNSSGVQVFIAEEKRLFGVSGFERYLAGRTNIFKPDRNNVAPYIAFAWDPFGDGRTAIRGGYGIYYDQIPGAVISQSRSVFPRFLTINLAGVSQNNTTLSVFNPIRFSRAGTLNVFQPSSFLGNNLADFVINLNRILNPTGNFFPGGPGFVLPTADLATPYSQHFSLTIERELLPGVLGSLAYVGTRGTHLLRFATPNLGANAIPVVTGGTVQGDEININGSVVSPGSNVAQGTNFRRPFPLLGSFTSIESDANSSYHSLQAEAQMRFSPRFKFTAAYTWSHAIDEVSDLFDLAGAQGIPQNSFDRSNERGDANFDVRHRFAGSYVWDLPFWMNNKVLGGWQLAGVVTLQTGQPFTPVSSVDVNLDGNLTDRLNRSDGIRTVNEGSLRYLFPADFTAQRALLAAAGVDGAVGRNTFRAPGIATTDLAVNKFFRFTEFQNLEVRVEVFNLFNRTHFGVPARQVFAAGLGRSVNTTVTNRTVQFALRYKF